MLAGGDGFALLGGGGGGAVPLDPAGVFFELLDELPRRAF